MSHFVLAYSRRDGVLISEIAEFSDRADALTHRFKLDSIHGGDDNIEITVLSANSRDALVATHARYFRTLRELVS